MLWLDLFLLLLSLTLVMNKTPLSLLHVFTDMSGYLFKQCFFTLLQVFTSFLSLPPSCIFIFSQVLHLLLSEHISPSQWDTQLDAAGPGSSHQGSSLHIY